MIEKWEFSLFPCEKDPQRYKLKLRSEEKDVADLMSKIGSSCGRAFPPISREFNWMFYVYNIEEKEKTNIENILNNACPNGRVESGNSMQLEVSQDLPPMLEDLLEVAANEFLQPSFEAKKQRKAGENTKVEEKDQLKEERGDFKELKKNEVNISLSNVSSTIPETRAPETKNEKNKLEIVFDDKTAALPQPEAPEIKKEENKLEIIYDDKTAFFEKNKDVVEEVKKENSEKVKEEKKEDVRQKEDKDSAGEWKEGQLIDDYLFSEFIVGPSNRFTHAAAMAVAESPGRIYNPFFIYGGVGLGKTHIMHAIGHSIKAKNPKAKILYVTTERFTSEVIEAIRQGKIQEFRNYYRNLDLLLVDDVQFLTESESTQEEFFHTFNILHEAQKQIVLSSDRPPKQLVTLEDRLRSRFEWGLIADIKIPNLETRVAILKKKKELDNIPLSESMLLYIASKLKSNIRELEGFLKRVDACSKMTQQEITMELVQELMKDLLPEEEKPVTKEIDHSPGVTVPDTETGKENNPPQVQEVKTSENKKNPIRSQYTIPKFAKQENKTEQKVETQNFASLQQKQEPKKDVKPVSPIPKMPVFTIDLKRSQSQAPAFPAGSANAFPADSGEDLSLKPVEVALFFPEGKESELVKIKDRFKDVVRKHKLKFRLVWFFEQSYSLTTKIDYPHFAGLCKQKNVSIAIVVVPPSNSSVQEADFVGSLSAIFEEEKLFLLLLPFGEINKDFKYLNLALDITLIRH